MQMNGHQAPDHPPVVFDIETGEVASVHEWVIDRLLGIPNRRTELSAGPQTGCARGAPATRH